jgi:hypothetical protein
MILASQAIALGTVEALKVLVQVSNTGAAPSNSIRQYLFSTTF